MAIVDSMFLLQKIFIILIIYLMFKRHMSCIFICDNVWLLYKSKCKDFMVYILEKYIDKIVY